jgi:hypothetical protein
LKRSWHAAKLASIDTQHRTARGLIKRLNRFAI